MKSDEDVRNMAGHPDVVPAPYREWFLKGYRAKEKELRHNAAVQESVDDIFDSFNLPIEATSNCPNCGKLCYVSQLRHTNNRLVTKLWGVCSDCAKL